MNLYTGREIAIFTDAHALLEPTTAILLDMQKRQINEKYSLGDNIGIGPDPSGVINLLREYSVISVAGNYEELCTLGIEPFAAYVYGLKRQSHLWTLSKLSEEQIGLISLYPRSIELLVGKKKVALCHFANDVRFDYEEDIRSAWTYQRNVWADEIGYEQFLYTNSPNQKREMAKIIEREGKNKPSIRGVESALNEPLFRGQTVDKFFALIQGHVHWKLYEESESTRFYSIRAVGMAYSHGAIDMASYVILKERIDSGFDFEEVLVPFDREKMVNAILTSDSPDTQIRRFTSM